MPALETTSYLPERPVVGERGMAGMGKELVIRCCNGSGTKRV